jgi:hypothetical protein
MSAELNDKDYTSILKYYKIKIPKSKRLLKMQAENIMSEKLCKCIKKLDPVNESRSIGICTKTILNNKGYSRGSFNCKGRRSIKLKKYNQKTRKNNK